MIKCVIKRENNGPLIVFGLSKMNIEKLKDGMPMKINLKELNLDGEVYIFAGETEAEMMKEMQDAGLLPAAFATDTAPN